jgi:hypothetical protein
MWGIEFTPSNQFAVRSLSFYGFLHSYYAQKRDDAEKNFNMKAFEEKERLVKANPLTDPAEMAAFEEQVRMAFRIRFRQEDNRLQALKGQPSLDNEDTGSQWLIHT